MKKSFLLIFFLLTLSAALVYAENAEELFAQAESYFEQKQYYQALDIYNLVYLNFEDYENADAAMFKAGMTEFRLELYEEAVDTLNRLIEKYPESRYKDDAEINIEIIEDYVLDKDSFSKKQLRQALKQADIDADLFGLGDTETGEEKADTGYVVLVSVSAIAFLILVFLIVRHQSRKRKHKHSRKH